MHVARENVNMSKRLKDVFEIYNDGGTQNGLSYSSSI